MDNSPEPTPDKRTGDKHSEEITTEERIEKLEAALVASDQKHSKLYGALVNKFIVNLGNRSYQNELSIKALSEVLGELVWHIKERDKEPSKKQTLENFFKRLTEKVEAKMVVLNNEVAVNQKAAEKEKAEKLLKIKEKLNDDSKQNSKT